MKNAPRSRDWLGGIGPHLYCCGHVHAAWASRPPDVPGQLCLNAGAPLLRDPTGLRPPGFLEIDLTTGDVSRPPPRLACRCLGSSPDLSGPRVLPRKKSSFLDSLK